MRRYMEPPMRPAAAEAPPSPPSLELGASGARVEPPTIAPPRPTTPPIPPVETPAQQPQAVEPSPDTVDAPG